MVVPVGIAAHFRRVPIVTHDSDSVPGLANRIVGRWAKLHATGMPAKYYSYPQESIKYVGIPLDPRIKKVSESSQVAYKKQLGLSADCHLLLLSGGGNGSKRLNDLLLVASKELIEADPKLRIVHVAGREHESDVNLTYNSILPDGEREKVTVLGFTPDFYAYSAAADLVITRAGATTLAELSVESKACIVIPSPYLTGGHQLKNAEELAAKDAVVVLQEDISSDELLAVTKELLGNDVRRRQLADNLNSTVKHNAAEQLATLIIEAAG